VIWNAAQIPQLSSDRGVGTAIKLLAKERAVWGEILPDLAPTGKKRIIGCSPPVREAGIVGLDVVDLDVVQQSERVNVDAMYCSGFQ
jgi:hypothetical protein